MTFYYLINQFDQIIATTSDEYPYSNKEKVKSGTYNYSDQFILDQHTGQKILVNAKQGKLSRAKKWSLKEERECLNVPCCTVLDHEDILMDD